MTTYMHQWMFLALLVVLGGMFAVDFVGAMVDGVAAQIVTDLESMQ